MSLDSYAVLTVSRVPQSPSASTSPGCCGEPRNRMTFHHRLQLPLLTPNQPLLVSQAQNKVTGGCLALAFMGKLGLVGLVSLQIQSPGRTIPFIRVICGWPV